MDSSERQGDDKYKTEREKGHPDTIESGKVVF